MWIKRNRLVLFSLRIGRFPIIIVFPFRCLAEVIEGIADLLSLFRGHRIQAAMSQLEQLIDEIRSIGALELVDVNVRSPKTRVFVRIALR